MCTHTHTQNTCKITQPCSCKSLMTVAHLVDLTSLRMQVKVYSIVERAFQQMCTSHTQYACMPLKLSECDSNDCFSYIAFFFLFFLFFDLAHDVHQAIESNFFTIGFWFKLFSLFFCFCFRPTRSLMSHCLSSIKIADTIIAPCYILYEAYVHKIVPVA